MQTPSRQTSTRKDQTSEAEANAVQSSLKPTDLLDCEQKSCSEFPTQVSAVIQAENVEDEREYIVGWRLYLLTSRFTCTEAGQGSTHEADSF